ncbi:App1 family protein [Mesonia sp. K7]|uniref:App1 family protein n=1 Tax=Mesonia sp. K7 TaxID=2218606 RepID=UPI000DA7FF73|nr:App1 family protein [Mesonia sp. K7]PZD77933.1 hypothetical protein DNG35_07525 [Mesonia sp. K7]
MSFDIKIYRGYANERKILILGHVFKKNAPDVFKLDKPWYKHIWQVIRMFRIKTENKAVIVFRYKDLEVQSKTLDDGHFRLMIPYKNIDIDAGWHQFEIEVKLDGEIKTETGEFVKPYPGEYGIISDIDDTFLVSHSKSFFKKLYVMLTRNVNKRKVFENVVEHYRFLNSLGRKDNDTNNAFFYVSSSEWNLYNFIVEFTKIHNFPKAVLQLKTIKSGLRDFIATGRGDHQHKYYKIRHIVEFYPELRFVLLGDDSQQDPYIYQDISIIFPNNISTVYIRQTRKHPLKKVNQIIKNLDGLGVKTCYFRNSEEAIKHSRENLG